MVYGSFDLILDDHPQIYAFMRALADDRLLVMLNSSQDAPIFTMPDGIVYDEAALLIADYPVDSAVDISQLTVRPYEARVYRLRSA